MALTAALVSATPYRQTYLLTQTAGGGSATIANATLLADAAASGPLRNAFSATYADQAAMRLVFGGGNVEMTVNQRTQPTGAAATDEHSWAVDVDVNAIAPTTSPEINIAGPTDACTAYLVIRYFQSSVA